GPDHSERIGAVPLVVRYEAHIVDPGRLVVVLRIEGTAGGAVTEIPVELVRVRAQVVSEDGLRGDHDGGRLQHEEGIGAGMHHDRVHLDGGVHGASYAECGEGHGICPWYVEDVCRVIGRARASVAEAPLVAQVLQVGVREFNGQR